MKFHRKSESEREPRVPRSTKHEVEGEDEGAPVAASMPPTECEPMRIFVPGPESTPDP